MNDVYHGSIAERQAQRREETKAQNAADKRNQSTAPHSNYRNPNDHYRYNRNTTAFVRRWKGQHGVPVFRG